MSNQKEVDGSWDIDMLWRYLAPYHVFGYTHGAGFLSIRVQDELLCCGCCSSFYRILNDVLWEFLCRVPKSEAHQPLKMVVVGIFLVVQSVD